MGGPRAALTVLLAGLWYILATAHPVQGQELLGPRAEAGPVLTVDIQTLFDRSLLGRRLQAEFTEAAEELARENDRIAEQLRAEEVALTERRASMDAADFRAEAEAFDARVQEIRAEQDAKEVDILAQRSAGEAQFIESIRPILSQITRERGATVIMERSRVLWADPSNDVTDLAVRRINAAIGDGTAAD